ncbi:MFS transporter [Candidatus Macondimonas diazotrophica]|jgi:predicted MFS family arabinose efflux permease|uniref:MFS transporter n=1 Tax=Candidatus Macondimonas diazotrophica TaxID=2305248 RepID=A0A4Z0F6I0_9GAMM|nr:MFS transporter [Candidatus Macondimonas diazotrophica]NCU00133.1 MFS transporter [Candidatus Macondimonas diazotrophica]TFZ81791.1 MFS transporter [Candidatus Macondimonas diazotrophica]HBG29352.1 MFS transporter [Gammaproteobacteria bacterium]HBG51588.1 MFS transporter [Gammaproteobacteria bacterium]
MTLKHGLILLTLVSVVADTMLLPFYPQFFAREFGNTSPEHVGFYIAACCFTVMVALPFWAKLARRINEFHIWVVTQIAAGSLGIAAYFTESLLHFWVITQTMLVFKASYLLIYPMVMRLEEKDRHLGVAGMFSVLMHFGAIGGALLGGAMLEFAEPRVIYLIMAATDALQVVVCSLIIRARAIAWRQAPLDTPVEVEPVATTGNPLIIQLGVISLLFYLSAFMMRPFFSRYWESVALGGSELVAGIIYAIPAWVALVGLWLNSRSKRERSSFSIVLQALVVAMIGAAIQSVPHPVAIVLGRVIFGWALFQGTVRLEVLVFELSSRHHYAIDFSKIHIFQNVGVLMASFAVGSVVSGYSLQMPFFVALAGFTLTAAVFLVLFGSRLWPSLARMPSA